MLRHERILSSEKLIYYSYRLFESFPALTCVVSTRLGGVSQGFLHSLNLSFRVGDEEEAVLTNRSRLYETINVNAQMVAQAQLVHGSRIELVAEDSPRGLFSKFPETDGLLTHLVNRPLFIPVADCAAVAFFDPQQHRIGLLHAGWKGVANRILPRMVATMREMYSLDPTRLLVGISPCLGPCCYEVRSDFVAQFTQALPQNAQDFLVIQPDKTIHFDLWAALRWQLQESGIPPEQIEGPALCTACHTDEFYSHRAEKGKTGRFACVMCLRTL